MKEEPKRIILTVSKTLFTKLLDRAKKEGIRHTEYVRALIINDLKEEK